MVKIPLYSYLKFNFLRNQKKKFSTRAKRVKYCLKKRNVTKGKGLKLIKHIQT